MVSATYGSVLSAAALPPILWLALRARRASILRRHHLLGLCRRCGYNLTGNTSGRCRECGEPVNADRRVTA
jgi:predicted amidophosphoribosyltransferase